LNPRASGGIAQPGGPLVFDGIVIPAGCGLCGPTVSIMHPPSLNALRYFGKSVIVLVIWDIRSKLD